mmetsp:Transcript_23459/g.89115  ORF Transcript_23459/g.89115 Transcript_23459/m.89115 type:complete len:238 (+) Transcript_23459:2440-3153(+)
MACNRAANWGLDRASSSTSKVRPDCLPTASQPAARSLAKHASTLACSMSLRASAVHWTERPTQNPVEASSSRSPAAHPSTKSQSPLLPGLLAHPGQQWRDRAVPDRPRLLRRSIRLQTRPPLASAPPWPVRSWTIGPSGSCSIAGRTRWMRRAGFVRLPATRSSRGLERRGDARLPASCTEPTCPIHAAKLRTTSSTACHVPNGPHGGLRVVGVPHDRAGAARKPTSGSSRDASAFT